MGTPQSTGRTEASWVRTILHEHFHQWQCALPDYFDRTKAHDLHDGDESGMWVLNFAFPYEDPVIIAAFANTSAKLSEAVKARGTPEFPSAVGRYVDSRKALAKLAGERNWRYLDFQLWQEGVARWTEIQLGRAYGREDVRESATKLEETTIKALASPDLAGRKREVVYAHGAAEAMLLTRGPSSKESNQACVRVMSVAWAAGTCSGPATSNATTCESKASLADAASRRPSASILLFNKARISSLSVICDPAL